MPLPQVRSNVFALTRAGLRAFLGLPVILPCLVRHFDHEFCLPQGVRRTVVRMLRCETEFERAVVRRYRRVFDQVVSKQQSVPVLKKLLLHNVNVVSALAAASIALDEPGVEGRSAITPRGTPEVIVAL